MADGPGPALVRFTLSSDVTPAGPPAGVTMSNAIRPPLVVIAGATATGKTELAIRLAEALIAEGRPTTVISADSRQVYRGLDIGTAKVSDADQSRVPHAGLDLVDPPDRFTASAYIAYVEAILADLATQDGVAILVGGTGLYLRAVARGLPLGDLPNDAAVRARLEDDFARAGLEPMVARLRHVAPILAAETHMANPRRVIRALEIAELRGDGARPAPRGYGGAVAWLGLEVEPEVHAIWIADRAARQFADGLVAEAVHLRDRHDPTLPISGVSILLSFRTMFSVKRAKGIDARVGFRFGQDEYVARVRKGEIRVARRPAEGADLILSGAPATLAAVVYGGQPLDLLGVTGDRALAERFVTLFPLPPKVGTDS